MQALNFYSTIFADQMKRGRKTATIRLGDKRHKYRKNQVVLVTVGYQYSPREKIFHAVIDNVEVKRVKELSPRDIEHDNPEFRRTEEMIHFLEQIYGREVTLEDTVTVVRFSQIIENPPDLRTACAASAARRTRRAPPGSNARRRGRGLVRALRAWRRRGALATPDAQVKSTSAITPASSAPMRSSLTASSPGGSTSFQATIASARARRSARRSRPSPAARGAMQASAPSGGHERPSRRSSGPSGRAPASRRRRRRSVTQRWAPSTTRSAGR